MGTRERRPIALTIAGSDSGGGAGIQADLKTFASLGVHGTSAITCITAQNPVEVRSVQAVKRSILRDQIEAILDELPPQCAKTGMLYSTEIIREVARLWRRQPTPLIVDPVMVSTSGARLLKQDAIRALLEDLLPLAALVTPNLDEAEIIVGKKLRDMDDMRAAAKSIYDSYGCPALIKGGHLKGGSATDVIYDGKREGMLASRYIRGVSTHGTGCTYSAAIAAYIAKGKDLVAAVRLAKGHITRAIGESYLAGEHTVLRTE